MAAGSTCLCSLAPADCPWPLPCPSRSGVRIRTRKRNIVVPHDPQVRAAAAAASAAYALAPACSAPASCQLASSYFRCPQSFADALIIIIDDAREGLEEGDRANVAKVLDAANKASITCVIRFHTASYCFMQVIVAAEVCYAAAAAAAPAAAAAARDSRTMRPDTLSCPTSWCC